jgi:hypothetical protein
LGGEDNTLAKKYNANFKFKEKIKGRKFLASPT